jgi:hypothetical protein
VTDSITVSLGTNPTGGVLSGTLTKSASAGVASFTNLQIDRTGIGYALSAVDNSSHSPSVTSASSSSFNVTVFVSNGFTLTDTATDAGSGVKSVAYYYCSGFTGACSSSTGGSTLIGTSTTGPNYSVTWNSQPSTGPYRVVAVGLDNVNNKLDASSATPVSVSN